MTLQTAALNGAADGVAGLAALMSLHNGDPGATGANEIAGGGYARQAVTWDPATGGIAAVDAVVSFAGTALQAITHVGLWTAAGAAWLGSDVPTGDLAFNAAGALDVTVATITATNP
jgi:hypothetical protein